MFTPENIQENMAVYSADGHKLGTVYIVEPSGFHIEKGFFFPRDYLAHYSDIREITRDGQIFLSRNKDELLEGAAAWEASASEAQDSQRSAAWETSASEARDGRGTEPLARPQDPTDSHAV